MDRFWLNRAFGRALVRNRCLRRARTWKTMIETLPGDRLRDAVEALYRRAGVKSSYIPMEYVYEAARAEVLYNVKRARAANRDWRKYRTLHQQENAL